MIAALVDKTVYTPDDLLGMRDEKQFELLDGRLVEKHMGAQAAQVGIALSSRLHGHASGQGLGMVFNGDCGYQCFGAQANRVRKPDVSFVARGRLPGDRAPRGWVLVAPDLAAEVVSPNDEAEEVEQKVEDFLAAGTRLVWVVYPNTRRVVVFRPDGSAARLNEQQTLDGEAVVPGFACPVAALFAGL